MRQAWIVAALAFMAAYPASAATQEEIVYEDDVVSCDTGEAVEELVNLAYESFNMLHALHSMLARHGRAVCTRSLLTFIKLEKVKSFPSQETDGQINIYRIRVLDHVVPAIGAYVHFREPYYRYYFEWIPTKNA